jgi:hypothetical protein
VDVSREEDFIGMKIDEFKIPSFSRKAEPEVSHGVR